MSAFIHTFGLLAMMFVTGIFVNYTLAVIDYAYTLNATQKGNN